MKNIVLIGIGGLGLRHLQAIMNLGEGYSIYGLDVNPDTIEKLKKEFDTATFCTSIDELPENIDVAIIATTSDVRRVVFEQLIGHSAVLGILFEKVLFQKKDDFEAVKELLDKNHIKAWVNCARREMPSFALMKEQLGHKRINSISVTGGDWGIATSAVHMMDLVEYLVGCDECEIVYSGLRPPIIESKRKGFFEYYGYIVGRCKNTDFCVKCHEDSSIPLEIFIETEDEYIRLIESQKRMFVANAESGWGWEEWEFPLPYVSQLTDKIVEKIVKTGTCLLPTYDVSMKTHLEYFRCVSEFLTANGMEGDVCPIT